MFSETLMAVRVGEGIIFRTISLNLFENTCFYFKTLQLCQISEKPKEGRDKNHTMQICKIVKKKKGSKQINLCVEEILVTGFPNVKDNQVIYNVCIWGKYMYTHVCIMLLTIYRNIRFSKWCIKTTQERILIQNNANIKIKSPTKSCIFHSEII